MVLAKSSMVHDHSLAFLCRWKTNKCFKTNTLFVTGGGQSVGKLRADFVGTSDEDSINDNASVISMASDTTFVEEGKHRYVTFDHVSILTTENLTWNF